MNTLLYHKAGAHSGPRLAAFMGIESCKSLDDRPDWLVRWGSARKVPYMPSIGTLNCRLNLAGYANRVEQYDKLVDREVPIPPYNPGMVPVLWANSSLPILGRDFGEDGQSTGGEGITYYCDSSEVPSDHDYYTVYLPKSRQYRVHAILNRFRIRELIPDTEDNRSKPIWNYNSGFTFRVPQDSIPSHLTTLAGHAVVALGLDFGAVDIIETPEGELYVLEVNTAPGLSDPTLEWYADKLGRIILPDPSDMPGWNAIPKETD